MNFSSVTRDFFLRVLLGEKLDFLPVRDFEGAMTTPRVNSQQEQRLPPRRVNRGCSRALSYLSCC